MRKSRARLALPYRPARDIPARLRFTPGLARYLARRRLAIRSALPYRPAAPRVPQVRLTRRIAAASRMRTRDATPAAPRPT
jgi:hypothetical protein